MAVCDICKFPGTGTLVSSEDIRKAVFKNGFNPLKLGLSREVGPILKQTSISAKDADRLIEKVYQDWRRQVAGDQTDWNLCNKCMSAIKPYLDDNPHSTRVAVSPAMTDLMLKQAELLMNGSNMMGEDMLKASEVVLEGLFTGQSLKDIEKDLVAEGISHASIREIMGRADTVKQKFGGVMNQMLKEQTRETPGKAPKKPWWKLF